MGIFRKSNATNEISEGINKFSSELREKMIEIYQSYVGLSNRLDNWENYLKNNKKEQENRWNTRMESSRIDEPFKYITDDGYVILKEDCYVKLPLKHKLITIECKAKDGFRMAITYRDECGNVQCTGIGNENYTYNEISDIFAEITRYYMRRK